jgi:predicted enzyme related to lactoylglutathione lyase
MAGEPTHFEIGVPDTDSARRFYGELLGWRFEPTGHGARIETPGEITGGMHREEGRANVQIYYVVPDLDEAAQKVVELGGEVDQAGEKGDQGRWLYSCRDDQGVPFGLREA